MASAHTRATHNVEELLAAVKHLSASELRKFEREFSSWRAQNGLSEAVPDDESLLAGIRQNSTLPAPEQGRFNHLRRKRQAEALTKSEERELLSLWQKVEWMNVARLGALAELARRRDKDVKTLMDELGITENLDVL